MNSENVEKNGHTHLQWIFALLANGTLLVYGMECGWISPFSSLLQSKSSPSGHPLSNNQLSWLASATSISAILAGPLYSYIADRFGRKVGVIIIALLETISWLIRVLDSSFILLLSARIIAGLGAAGCFTVIPVYIKEICQDNLIGILGTLPMIMNSVGIFLMYLLGAYLEYNTVVVITAVVSVVTMIAMFKAPESPGVLVKRGEIDRAIETVALLRGLDKNDDDVKKIVGDMIEAEARFRLLPPVTLNNILKNRSWRHGCLLIAILFTCFQMNGAFAVLTFATIIMSSTGIEFNISPEVQTLSFPGVMIVASILLTFFVERCGRKPLLVGAFAITSLCMFGMVIIITVQKRYESVPAWLPACVLMIAVAMFSGGISPLSFIVLTEMFTFQIRVTVITFILTYGWILLSIQQSTYTTIVDTLGEFAPFILYGLFNLIGAAFVVFFLSETKGKTDAEIYRNVNKNYEVNGI